MAKWRGDAWGAERGCHHARGDASRGETSWRWEGVRSSDSGHGWASDSGHGCEEGYATLLELVTSEDINFEIPRPRKVGAPGPSAAEVGPTSSTLPWANLWQSNGHL